MAHERYQLRRMPIARGGMGDVWQGWDTQRGREVAVKFPRLPDGAERATVLRAFLREARLMKKVRHRGVPTVCDVGTDDGCPYLVMRWVPGSRVSDLLATGTLRWEAAVSIAARACAALAAIHEASVVHGDIKPANLILEPGGDVAVVDFGLAVRRDSPAAGYQQMSGTPAYLAPEQALMAVNSPRTDLYALGCTLHEMLTGLPPALGWGPELPPEVPEEVDDLRRSLLATEPERGPASAVTTYRQLSKLAALAGATAMPA